MTKEILYVPDLAEKLGRTPAAIRVAVQRDQDRLPADKALPRAFKIGARWAWRAADVDAWLKAKAAG